MYVDRASFCLSMDQLTPPASVISCILSDAPFPVNLRCQNHASKGSISAGVPALGQVSFEEASELRP